MRGLGEDDPQPWRPNLKRRVARLFGEIDADGDGVLSREEVADKLRTDDELQALMEMGGKGAHYIFEQLDTDGDANIDLEEFLKILDAPEEEEEEEEAEDEAEEDGTWRAISLRDCFSQLLAQPNPQVPCSCGTLGLSGR